MTTDSAAPLADPAAERRRRASSFGAIAEDYDRLRPTPPDEALRWLLPAGAQTVVDVGAGTGLLTRALIPRVAHVICVEPDARMRAVLARRSPHVTVYDGRAEQIPLPDDSVDCVLFASSWHWVDPPRAVPEIARVLRLGGHLGALWTSRDRRVDWVRNLDHSARTDDEQRMSRPGQRELVLPPGSPFSDVQDAEFTFAREMAVDDVVALMATYSGTIVASAQERDARLAHTREVLTEHVGSNQTVAVPHRCVCRLTVRTASPSC